MFENTYFAYASACFSYSSHYSDGCSQQKSLCICIKYASRLSIHYSRNSKDWRCWTCFLTILQIMHEIQNHCALHLCWYPKVFFYRRNNFYSETLLTESRKIYIFPLVYFIIFCESLENCITKFYYLLLNLITHDVFTWYEMHILSYKCREM